MPEHWCQLALDQCALPPRCARRGGTTTSRSTHTQLGRYAYNNRHNSTPYAPEGLAVPKQVRACVQPLSAQIQPQHGDRVAPAFGAKLDISHRHKIPKKITASTFQRINKSQKYSCAHELVMSV